MHVTFGCLNHAAKVSADVLALWARVMRAVDGSRLIMLSPEGPHRNDILGPLEQGGVVPGQVGFVAHQPPGVYLKVYHGIDLVLDTLPYNGPTTSLDAFAQINFIEFRCDVWAERSTRNMLTFGLGFSDQHPQPVWGRFEDGLEVDPGMGLGVFPHASVGRNSFDHTVASARGLPRDFYLIFFLKYCPMTWTFGKVGY